MKIIVDKNEKDIKRRCDLIRDMEDELENLTKQLVD